MWITCILQIYKEDNYPRKAYAIRMIYIGEHTLPKEEMIQHFQKTVHGVNAGYCEINVYGFLLVYDSYFVHIIEGSEDTVHRQLRFLFQLEVNWIKEMKRLDEEAASRAAAEAEEEGRTPEPPKPIQERKMFKRLKLLMVYHSIQTMLFDSWRAVTARPPSLVGKLDIHGPFSEHIEQLSICLDKITKLCNLAKLDEMLKIDDSFVEPLPVMPWEVKKEKAEDEEKEEQQSGSSSSD
ncbi:hypothetical protein O3G_MSEX002183 [Manduca sexta]|uniref:Uncharacterized protein n=1 Tax=Manduca sexta TaxID=7130 RepID=A0A921YML6_MANSE|nr:hypothetical protein O3G_MSEX002183 [Manduca sexta]